MNDKCPGVTVITATYKKFDHILQTIKSVLSQTYSNIQYIITDDGSPNFPESMINSLNQKWNIKSFEILIIHHKKNMGTVKNLNYAFKHAKGDYFINLSCGDVFFDEMVIEKIVDRFCVTQCDVLVTSRILYSNNFNPICLLPHFDERKIIFKYRTGIEQYKAFITSRSYDMASGSAMYFSSKILKQLGYYDERYLLWEDGPFLAKYLQIGKLEFAYDIISIWYEAGGISDLYDKQKANIKTYATSLKLMEDTRLFIMSEKVERLDLFTYREKRLIHYQNLRMICNNSIIRYFLYMFYFPELLSSLCYNRKRQNRYKKDQVEISRILNLKLYS